MRIPWAVTKEALARVLQLNVSMLDRYQHIKEYVEQVIEHRARRKPKYSEDELVGKVQEAVESFRSLGKPITHKSIANEICVDSEVLRHSLRASAVVGRAIEEDRADRLRKYEDKLINRIQSAVQELNLSGDAVTKMAVGRKIHVIPQVLKHYARVDAFLNQLLQENAEREFRRWEEELFGQVQAAIQQLGSCRRRVTENAICTIVQAPPTRLRKSSRIRAILEQVREKSPGRIRERTGICEDDLLHKMQCAMEQLRTQGKPITRMAISQEAGVSVYYMKRFQSTSDLLRQAQEITALKRKEDFREREEALIRQIDATVKRMEVSGEPITKKVVADKLGRDRKGLQHYPAASAFLEQAVMDAQARQFQRRTEDILDRMNAVIARMEDQNERATVSAVAEELQMSVGSLRYYPQVRPMLKSLVQGQANDTEIKLQARDRRLVEKVEKAVEKQESQGDPVNYQVVSEMTAISIKVLKRRIQLRQIIEEAIIRAGQVATSLSQE